MPFLNWLFRRRCKAETPATPERMEPLNLSDLHSLGRNKTDRMPPFDFSGLPNRETAPPITQEHPQKSAYAKGLATHLAAPLPKVPPGEWLMEYATPGTLMAPRRLLPLFASPPNFLTGIDLDKRRIRTYRTDRMGLIRTAAHPDGRPAALELAERADTSRHRASSINPDEELALIMLHQMYAQLAILRLLSVADGTTTEEELDRILAYARRDNRFAVNDFVPTGDKRRVWPILRDLIRQITPEEQYLDVYSGSIREEWENPRRFKVLSEALTDLANMTEARHPVMTRIVRALNQ